MSNFTANFRLYHRKRAAAGLQPAATFRKEELALIEALERQRHRTGRVRAIIDDPANQFPTILQAYLNYIQSLDPKDALIVEQAVEQAISLRPNPRQNFRKSAELQRSHYITPRSYLKILGAPRCIGQILLLNSHAYCPSLPLCRSRLDQILQLALPYVNGHNTVVIIHGSTRTPKNTRFRHWVAQAVEQAISLRQKASQSVEQAISLRPPASQADSLLYTPLYLPYGAEASSFRCAERKPRKSPRRPLIVRCRPSHGCLPARLTTDQNRGNRFGIINFSDIIQNIIQKNIRKFVNI